MIITILNQKIALTGTRTDRISQMLKMAGWHKDRCVDISSVERYYEAQRVTMTVTAKKFLQEYYGIADAWYITHDPKQTSSGLTAPDFQFELFPSRRLDEVSEFVFDIFENGYPVLHENQVAVNGVAKEETTLIGEIGYYYPARTWIGRSGSFYTTHEYDHGEIHIYRSLMEFLDWELSRHSLDFATILRSDDL